MADEPTGNLDSNNAKAIHQLFVDLSRQFNQTFIMITHNEELAKLTDRTLIMKDGQIVEELKYNAVHHQTQKSGE
jgi:lipoprotein-releasing system ATP-binding protein